MNLFFTKSDPKSIPIIPLPTKDFSKWLARQKEEIKNLVKICNFKARSAEYLFKPSEKYQLQEVILGVDNEDDFWAFGDLARKLPAGNYHLVASWKKDQIEHAFLAWGLGAYHFTNYKKAVAIETKLFLPAEFDQDQIVNLIDSMFLARDLINLPAVDLTPEIFADKISALAKEIGATFNKVVGKDLMKNFPAVYAVGKGSANPPVLAELRWGNKNAPKLTIVGKGVCFDSGGINLKPEAGLILMKKDMAGAAITLGLARLVIKEKLPVNLRAIFPLVENMVSGLSFKPGDIVKTRAGLAVEIMNTDAEGRLILADALSYASEDKPDLLIDFSTLTGAANVALGEEIAALFSDDDKLAKQLVDCGTKEKDYLWQLPLFEGYRAFNESKIADLVNLASFDRLGAAITAALFLQTFVKDTKQWVHFDHYSYNRKDRPGRPQGGEAKCLRAVFRYLVERFK
jgi:leucyl aminopeptidase